MATIARAACRAGIASAALAAALLLVLQQLPAAGPDTGVVPANQAAIIERALSELQPSSPSDPSGHLYFVGFAGYGPEAVFKREVVAVRELFNARFGTRGRSVALVNHVTTVDELPLASAQNLERVLQHMGKIMDASRDTVFLFLTSHGERALLAVEMPGVRLEHLTPAMLKRMLDRSGIKRRIVVVSACHSGSFIPALANPNTLVIAAARADRTSFGCADKRQWTYFGDAYFNRALRQETSFRKAFERARRLVARWETKGRLVPSLPQIMGGEALMTE
jgi:peptidase C13-like protein